MKTEATCAHVTPRAGRECMPVRYTDCIVCGELFTVRGGRRGWRQRQVCYSDACTKRHAADNQRARDWRYAKEHGHQRQRKGPQRTATCDECAQQFTTRRKDQTVCSWQCQWHIRQRATAQANRDRAIARRLPAIYQGDGTVHATHRRWTSGQCQSCGDWYLTDHDTTKFCSNTCSQRASHERRRARKADAYIANVPRKQVFARDGYRCHLCGKKTNPAKQVPHPRAPTIDHIIPLAAGGTHEPLNCRTACFRCNSVKGDRGGGEQLLLVA